MGWEDKFKRGGRGGSGGFDKMPDIDMDKFRLPSFKPSHVFLLIGGFFLVWLATGLYKVELQERALVLVLGKQVSTTDPGLHWNIPSPFGHVVKVRTEEIKRVEIGFRSNIADVTGKGLKKESMMLTEGANIIDIQMSVQYKVKDPSQFIFGVADPFPDLKDRGLYDTVKDVAEATLREVVGKNSIDDILTVGKNQVQLEILEQMQQILDHYQAGITISLVQLQDVHPPDEVRESFRDVNNAEEDKNRLIREAEGYKNSIIPEARGEAAQIVAKAEAYAGEKINISQGDAEKFVLQFSEYRKAPDITRTRLYLEMMEEVMSKVDKVILDEKVGKSVLPLLQLNPAASRQAEIVPPQPQSEPDKKAQKGN